MIATIVRKELRLALRAGRIWPLLAAWVALSLLAALGSISAQQRAQAERAAAAESDRRTWEAQGPRNPHSAAHFGQYAYKPATALGALEPGLDAWLGASVWMEAHYQNPASQRAAEDLTPLSRMGALSLGWMLQVLLPLTVLVLGFDLLAEDRARGVLKLQRVAGASASQLLFGKGLSLLVTTLIVTAPGWMAALVIALATQASAFADAPSRFTLWLLAYAAFGLIWMLLTLAISGLASSARLSLAALSGLWLIGVLLLPRLAAEQAESAHPAPEPSTFWQDIKKAQSQGIDGHEPGDARIKQLQAETMQRYGVSRMEDLPISFAGVALQASEEYGNQVYDRFFDQLWSGYAAQAGVQARWAWAAPVLAARDLATQAAGTDVAHHRRFAHAAETHRRDLQRFLNGDMTAHGKGKDYDYLAPADFWAKAPGFIYQPPALHAPVGAIVVLAAWLLLGLLACIAVGRRVETETAT